MSFIPSQYQLDVFEFIKYGYGNAVISAVAGSGKSSTIIKALDYIKPDKKVLFLAFNASIVNDLKNKINRPNTDIKTLHSLGFSMLRYHFKDINIQIYENKYRDKLNLILRQTENNLNDKYIKNILKLCDLGRFYMAKSTKELQDIANKYSLISIADEICIAFELIEWAKDSLTESGLIDYIDMIYLPNVLNLKAIKYDFIMIDEAQDLSMSQMELFLKCLKQGSRFIAVGDEKQSIYSFSGANIDSFSKIKNIKNTIELPLSISYRCPKSVVRLAQKLVKEIEYSETAIEGIITYSNKIDDLKDGDMVICRNSLPLVKLYLTLLTNNINCYIKGIDIGENLLELLDYSDSNDIKSLLKDLNNLLISYVNNNVEAGLLEEEIITSQNYSDLADKIECLKILSNNIDTKIKLKERIINIFSDTTKQGICLSTIHKAKGLEADNVYILNKNLIPKVPDIDV